MAFSSVRCARAWMSASVKDALGRGHRFDRFLERPLLAIAAFENAGLVEVDMGLDEPGDHQPAVELLFRRVGSDMGSDVDDAAVRDADVDRSVSSLPVSRP